MIAHTLGDHNQQYLKSPFQTPVHKIFKNCFSLLKFFTAKSTFMVIYYVKSGLKCGILNIVDYDPFGNELSCCGSICHEFHNFF